MKNKLIVALTVAAITFSNGLSVYADTTETTSTTDFENLSINIKKYDYLLEKETFEYSPILNLKDVEAAVKSTKQDKEPHTFNLSVEQAVLFLVYKSDMDFDEMREDLEESKSEALGKAGLIDAALKGSAYANPNYSDDNSNYAFDISPLVSYQSGLYNLEYAIDIVDDTEKLMLDTFEYLATNFAINDVKLSQTIELLEAVIADQETELARTQLKYDLGYVSDVDLKDAKTALETQKSKLATTKKTYENFKITVAQQLGIKENDIVNFDYDVVLEPVTKTADEYVSYFLKYSPTVNMSQADRERYNNIYDVNAMYYIEPSSTLESDRDEAIKSANDSISGVMATTRQNYNTLQNTVTEVQNAEVELNKAKDTYDRAVLMYDLGYVAKSQLDKAALGVTSAENTFVQALYDYDLDRLKLEKSGSLSSSKTDSSDSSEKK